MPDILMFEADAAFIAEVRQGLSLYDCTLTVFEDATVGLAAAQSARPDLILLTIELPRMNGFSVCNKLKRDDRTQNIPVIILSSDSTEETFDLHRKLRTRADAYAHKPIAFESLLEQIRAFVQLRPSPRTAMPSKPSPTAAMPLSPSTMGATIFLSYRRKDSAYAVDAIGDMLRAEFGPSAVFQDIDNIPPGTDFREHIAESIRNCRVVLAVIGDAWLGIGGAETRIMRSTDPVRVELEIALAKGITTIPILVGAAEMPASDQVPASLSRLPFLNALRYRAGRDRLQDLQRIVSAVARFVRA